MIQTKEDLKRYILEDNGYLNDIRDKKTSFFMRLVHDEEYMICKYLKYLRKQEYYINTSKGNKIKELLALLYERKKHNLGNKLGFYIGPNCFDSGLTIYHHGSIIVNPSAKIGKNCKLHGNNCIGNKGNSNETPVIGNNADLGFGSVVIGNVRIANNVTVGANAVVTKSFDEDGSVIVGVPAKRRK